MEAKGGDAVAGEVSEDGTEYFALLEHQSVAEAATPCFLESGVDHKDHLLGPAHPPPLGQSCVEAGGG